MTSLQNKREEYVAKLAKQHRQNILKTKRVLKETNEHSILIVPALVSHGDHEMLQKTLDQITLLPKETAHQLVDSTLLFDAYRQNDKPQLVRSVFKTINRLQYWHQSWLDQALDYLKQDQSMIKEIAFFVQRHQLLPLSQRALQTIVNTASANKQHILYFIYIFNTFWDSMTKQQQTRVLPIVNKGVSEQYDVQKISLAILSKYSQSCSNIGCLNEISQIAMSSDFQTSSTAFDIMLNLAADDRQMDNMIKNHNFMNVVRKYMRHPFQVQRRAAYWGFSNICASYQHTRDGIQLASQIIQNYKLQQGVHQKTQIQYSFVNLLTMMNHSQLESTKLDDILFIIIEALDNLLPDLVLKSLFSLISALNKYDRLKILLERMGIQRHLHNINCQNPQIDELCQQLSEMLKQQSNIT